MEQFLSQLEAMRSSCRKLPYDFFDGASVGEREALRKIIDQVEAELTRVRHMSWDM